MKDRKSSLYAIEYHDRNGLEVLALVNDYSAMMTKHASDDSYGRYAVARMFPSLPAHEGLGPLPPEMQQKVDESAERRRKLLQSGGTDFEVWLRGSAEPRP